MTKPLSDSMAEYIGDALPQDAGTQQRTRAQRAYMAGALEVMARLGRGEDRQALLREVLGYGRTIGSAVERSN